MNTSAKNCIAVFLAAFAAGLTVFLLSLFQVFSTAQTIQFLNAAVLVAFILYGVVFYTLLTGEKNRLVREAVCCCGKLTMIGFTGTILASFFTLLLYGGTIRILFDLGLGFVFFFLTMILAGMGCIITIIYQCRRNDC